MHRHQRRDTGLIPVDWWNIHSTYTTRQWNRARQCSTCAPDLEEFFAPDSIAIAALLHDVCKADFYKLAKKKRRNEVGQYEDFEQYEIHDENFPVGHGEKSVILLLQSGLDLKDDEIYAIRWHMGPWNLSRDDEKFYRQSGKITPSNR